MRRKCFLALTVFAVGTCTVFGGGCCVLAEEAAQTAEKTEETQDGSTETAVETEEAAADKEEAADGVLEDGVYSAEFDTDSSMFHVNEAMEGRGTLTVKDGEMTIHVSLVSKSILNLFAGTAEDAQKEGAALLEPTTDSVTYSDGWKEEVYGFDIPVPALDEEFDVALLGKKGKWYDHKVSVTDPKPQTDTEDAKEAQADAESEAETDAGDEASSEGVSAEELNVEDGSYTAEVTLEGGSGKATVESPAAVEIKDQKAVATLIWSSPNYDYMIVEDEKYEMVNTEGNSTFEIPVRCFDGKITVIADTVAMSTPHEIEYTLIFDSSTLKRAEES